MKTKVILGDEIVLNKKIVASLEKIGLSTKESEVYYTLLKEPFLNGSQISRILNYPRPNIYDILRKLLDKGYIMASQEGGTTSFVATDYEVVLEKLKKDLADTKKILQHELKDLQQEKKRNDFFNLNSEKAIMKKIEEMLTHSEKEVYINTNFNLDKFKDIFEKLKKKKVRIILFSYKGSGYEHLGIEDYYRPGFDDEYIYRGKRIILVSDMKKAIMACNDKGDFTGTYSENPLLVNIAADNVHDSIYATKTEAALDVPVEKFLKIINIHTIHERPRKIKK